MQHRHVLLSLTIEPLFCDISKCVACNRKIQLCISCGGRWSTVNHPFKIILIFFYDVWNAMAYQLRAIKKIFCQKAKNDLHLFEMQSHAESITQYDTVCILLNTVTYMKAILIVQMKMSLLISPIQMSDCCLWDVYVTEMAFRLERN